LHAIARQLELNIHTVRKYSRLSSFPQRTFARRRPRKSIVEPYRDYLTQRLISEGGTSRQLWHEIQEQGFTGGHTVVYRYLLRLRQALGLPSSSCTVQSPSLCHLTAHLLATLVLRLPEELSQQQQQLIVKASQLHPDIQRATQLAADFASLLRSRHAHLFPTWLQQVETSSLTSLLSFAAGIRRDYTAVQAAVTLSWSNGQTEGQVNRLKLIKRQMYGRARFDLLRLRVLDQ
jgi:transposase